MIEKEIVKVTVDIDDQAVVGEGFGIPLILGSNKLFNERYKLYSSTDEMITDGFTVNDPEYLAAAAIFEQEITVDYILVGRRTVDEVTITVSTVTNSTLYTTTINGTAINFTSDVSATAAEIAGGLVTAINLQSANTGVTATDETGGVYSLIANVLGNPYTIKTDLKQTLTKPFVASDAIEDDLTAVLEATDDWYGLVLTTRVENDVKATAAWIQQHTKIFFTASNNANILDSESTTDIAYFLNSMNYDRTAVIYHPNAALYPDAALFGARLSSAPGEKQFGLAQLTGIPSYKLTSSQAAAALAKKCNIIQTMFGVSSITFKGTMASGRFIDVRRDIDWLISIIVVAYAQRLLDQALKKVPMTDAGGAILHNILQGQLDVAVTAGVLAQFPRPAINVPLVKNIPINDRDNRIFSGITFVANLAGAVLEVVINGIATA